MRRPLAVLALAAAIGGAAVAPASAEQILPQNSGLTEPGGVVRTPDGAIWVTDGLTGVCKVNAARNGLVEDRFCAPENHAVEAPPNPGPSAAFDIAFDEPSSSFYVAEGASGAAGVWRMKWVPGPAGSIEGGTIESAERIVDVLGDRVMGLALGRVPGPGGIGTTLEVDFTTKDSRLVQRITGADTAAPVTLPVATTAQDVEVAAIARLNGDLYLGEPVVGVTRVDPDAPNPVAQVVPGLAGVPAGALAADETRNRLYVGTDNGTGADEVLAVNGATGASETYASGLASVSGLGVDADGTLLAADDPATAAGGVDVVGGGRIFRFGLLPLARPTVSLTAAPPTIGTARTVTFSYASRTDASFECTVDAVARACPSTGGAGSVTFDVLDGTHEFEVRAIAPDGATTVAGQSIRHVFTVDTTAPEVSIDNPAADRRIERRSLDLDFTSNEAGATFTCAVDGAAPAPCGSPLRLRNLALGAHTVQVWATDRVGHTTAAPAEWAFEVADPPPPPPVPPTTGGGTSGSGSSGSDSGTSGQGGGSTEEPRRRTEPSRNDPCPASVSTVLDFRRPPAVVRVAFPSSVRPAFVRMAILKQRPGRAPVKVATMHRELRGGTGCASVTWGLWRREASRLRSGRYLLRVHAGASRSTVKQVWLGGLRVRR